MTGTDLFGTGSGSYGNDADAWDEDFYERLEQMPPEVQRAELQVTINPRLLTAASSSISAPAPPLLHCNGAVITIRASILSAPLVPHACREPQLLVMSAQHSSWRDAALPPLPCLGTAACPSAAAECGACSCAVQRIADQQVWEEREIKQAQDNGAGS